MDTQQSFANEAPSDLGDVSPPSIGPGPAPRPPTRRSWFVREVLRPWAVASVAVCLLFAAGYLAFTYVFDLDEGSQPYNMVLFARTDTTTTVEDGVRHWDVGFVITMVVRGDEDVTWQDVHVMVDMGLRGGVDFPFGSGNASGAGAGAPAAVYDDRAGGPTTLDEGDRFTLANLDRTFQGANFGLVFLMTYASDFHSGRSSLGMWNETLSLELDAPTALRVEDPVSGTTWSFRLAVGNVTPGDERAPWRDVLLVLLTPGYSTDELPGSWLLYPLETGNLGIMSAWAPWRIDNGSADGYITPGDVIIVEGVPARCQAGEGHRGAILLVMTGRVCLDLARLPVQFP